MTLSATQERIINETYMYGERPEIFWERHKNFVAMTGVPMFLAGLMSDAQECIAHGMDEEARRILNKAKWVIANQMGV